MQDVQTNRRVATEVLEEPVQPAEARRDAVWSYHVVLALFTFLWGSNFVLAEVALLEMTPISFSVARFLMGGLGMLALFFAQHRVRTRPLRRLLGRLNRAEWIRLLLVAFLGATLAPWLGIEGLALTYAGRAAFWLALAPAVSAVIGFLLHTERINTVGRVGLLLAGLGTLGLALDGFASGRSYWLGDLLLFVALLMAVSELHLIKPLAYRYGAIPIVTARTIIGGLIYVAIASPSVVHQPWLGLSFWTWIAIVVGGIVGVGMGQWVKVRALHVIGPTQVVIYGNLVPLATLLIGWLALGTTSSALEIVAGLLIVLGAYCVHRGGSPVLERDPAVG